MFVFKTDEFWHLNFVETNIHSLALMEVLSKRWKVQILLSFHYGASFFFILIPSSLPLDTHTVYLISRVIQPWCLFHQCKWNLGFYNFAFIVTVSCGGNLKWHHSCCTPQRRKTAPFYHGPLHTHNGQQIMIYVSHKLNCFSYTNNHLKWSHGDSFLLAIRGVIWWALWTFE